MGDETSRCRLRGVTTDGGDVDHPVSELDKSSPDRGTPSTSSVGAQWGTDLVADIPLDGGVEVGNVVQDEPGQLFVLFLADMSDETLTGELDAHLVGRQSVLGEPVIERVDGLGAGGSELFLDLDEVGTADKGDDAFFAEVLQKLDHLGLGGLQVGANERIGTGSGHARRRNRESVELTCLAAERVPSTSL